MSNHIRERDTGSYGVSDTGQEAEQNCHDHRPAEKLLSQFADFERRLKSASDESPLPAIAPALTTRHDAITHATAQGDTGSSGAKTSGEIPASTHYAVKNAAGCSHVPAASRRKTAMPTRSSDRRSAVLIIQLAAH